MIEVENLTLKYASGKGIFDVDFKVKEGQVMGYLGPNGAGKTTTIRAIMGFMKPNSGKVYINGLDAYDKAPEMMKFLGYLPGEISFPENMKGDEFLRHINEMRGLNDNLLMNSLVERFELDVKGEIKKYSKGMKQKLGLIIAFMHDPKVLILDEPTSGLDPLMQNVFVDLILEEKKKGKTILISSHMFEEVERTCDEVLIIREGKLIVKSEINELKNKQRKAFNVFTNQIDKLSQFGFDIGKKFENGLEMFVDGEDIDSFIKKLATIKITNFEQKTQSLEDIFLNFYKKESKQ